MIQATLIRRRVIVERGSPDTAPVLALFEDGTIKRFKTARAASRCIADQDKRTADKNPSAAVITTIEWRGIAPPPPKGKPS